MHRPFTPEEITAIQELTTDKLRDRLIKAKELINQIEEELYSTDFETHSNAMWYGINIINFIYDFFKVSNEKEQYSSLSSRKNPL